MGTDPEPSTGTGRRRFPAARLRRRGERPEPGGDAGTGGSLFAPRSFAGGQVQVWGCSPGCLVASLLASIVLTLLLNALL